MKDAATETPCFSHPNLSDFASFLLLFHIAIHFEKVLSAPLRRFLPTQDTTWARVSLEDMLILIYIKLKMVSETIFLDG